MKKWLIGLLALVLLAASLPSLPASAASLADVSGHWAETAITYLVDKGIINGFPDGTFKPEEPVTRAQFAKMVTLALEYPTANEPATPMFSDVTSSFWGFQSVEISAAAGLIMGFPDGTFAPDKNVTKAEAVTILTRARSMFLKDFNLVPLFSDVPEGNWAVPYLNAANGMLFFPNSDPHILSGDTFLPDQPATRAQAATFIYRLMTMEPLTPKAIVIKGSDTMVNLASAWAEAYQVYHPEVKLTVSGGGSGIGIAALQNKTTDICNNSRPWKDEEIAKAGANGVNPAQTVVAQDAVSVIVNPENPVKELTMTQLSLIYQGITTNWKEVGGPDATIVVLSRDTNSGTHVFFKEHVLQSYPTADKTREYGKDVQFLPTNQAIHDEVARNIKTIGYVGLGYIDETVKALGIKKGDGDAAVLPSAETVLDKTYPVARPLFCTVNGQPTNALFAYLQWILGPVGQQIVSALDFVTVGK